MENQNNHIEGYQTLSNDWKIENNGKMQKIVREFKLVDFASALKLANKIGEVAEKIGHHPEISISWGKLKVETTTHDGGNVLSKKDFELAMAIDLIDEN